MHRLHRSFTALLVVSSCADRSHGGAPVVPIAHPDDVSAARFAIDLRTRLVAWYHVHRDDLGGGADLDRALASVDVLRVRRVRTALADPLGVDRATTAVFLHPDVVWPDSDRVWVGAYTLGDGALVAIDDFE